MIRKIVPLLAGALLIFAGQQSFGQTLSYSASTATPPGGAANMPLDIGEAFSVNTPVRVSALGVYDFAAESGGALVNSHYVSLFDITNANAITLVATATAPAGVPASATQGEFAFAALSTPVTLSMGSRYFIEAYQLNTVGGDPYGEATGVTFNSSNGAIANYTCYYSFTTNNNPNAYEITSNTNGAFLASTSMLYTVVPEPSTWIIGLLFPGMLALLGRRRLRVVSSKAVVPN